MCFKYFSNIVISDLIAFRHIIAFFILFLILIVSCKINELSIIIQELSIENNQLKDKVKYLEDKIKQLIIEQIQLKRNSTAQQN